MRDAASNGSSASQESIEGFVSAFSQLRPDMIKISGKVHGSHVDHDVTELVSITDISHTRVIENNEKFTRPDGEEVTLPLTLTIGLRNGKGDLAFGVTPQQLDEVTRQAQSMRGSEKSHVDALERGHGNNGATIGGRLA